MRKYRKGRKPRFTKYKIIVPSEQDKKDLIDAFRHIHYSDIDTDYVTVNQIAHEYLGPDDGGNNIIVDESIYHKLKSNNVK